jgi:hypothetical protein
MFAAVRESGYVQVFGRRQDAASTCSDGRRPKSAKDIRASRESPRSLTLSPFRRVQIPAVIGVKAACSSAWGKAARQRELP